MVQNVFDRGNVGVIILGASHDLGSLLPADAEHPSDGESDAMNMQKRARHILAAVLALAVFGFAVFAIWPTTPLVPGVTRENFARIRHGMTHKEVEDIFGKPCDVFIEIGQPPRLTFSAEWNDVGVFVFFNADSRVIGKRWGEEPESIMDKINRWIRLQ